ncbi:tyrosine-type recombinase/integrase [Clostridium sp. C8-1-8]|uniref:tyrosine-type recombinase/integrase n=1 Tax=Clostridium sp. C8-1-8 TaxID=2698831 RepID=UPI00136D73CD|nr:tyrosine-type recombinase/integrase [Clostridium sp. C8-1-8]
MPKIQKKFLTVEDAIEDFLIYCTNKNLSIKTRKSYESTLKLFSKFLEEECNITNVESVVEKNIREYIEFTKERGKYSFISSNNSIDLNNPSARKDFGKDISISTLNNYIRNIKVFFNFLYENNLIPKDIVSKVKQYKNSHKPKAEITDADFKKLISSLDITVFAEYRDYVIIQLLTDTGMRIGECLALEVDNILLDKRAIFIPADITKGKKDRYVFFSITMKKVLSKWLAYKDRYLDTDLVFVSNRNNKLDISNFEKNLKKYVARTNINKNITAHVFRNNFARRYLLASNDIYGLSRILGHSSVTVTEQAYLDLTVEDIRKNYQQFSPLENMK